MIIKTPDPEVAQIEELLASVHASVTELRHEVNDLKNKVEAGEDVDDKNTRAKVTSLGAMVHLCQKVETQLVACKQQRGAAFGGVTLDLEAARAEIGCRLARLAKCGGS